MAALVKFDSGVTTWWCDEHAELDELDLAAGLPGDESTPLYSVYPRCEGIMPGPVVDQRRTRAPCDEPATAPLAMKNAETLTVTRCIEHARRMIRSGLWVSINAPGNPSP